ncbi:hypothetical protein [Dietzia psychralcaliphila]|uniref:Enoyl-CoA hydratase/isomerase-like protein n=1 Tax=Dietzia psychralcaliphila TaxID=139021 RepID=A0AAD0JTG0_9ACTN|nr:hypothetical protein [Dietzia psychralcaliphila]AWH96287.1 hypothetical protein A6048_13145 [Dietzia psychralcaliphila]PTM90621.1 hypothetical protein C8N39_101375 [Dietzia psychralcaliphila]
MSCAAVAPATAVSGNAVLADRASKSIMTGSREWTSEVEFGKMRDIFPPVRSSIDAREGVLAFTQKRAPRWTAT